MSKQDERERALVRVGVDVGSDCRHRPLSDEECDVLRYAAGPRPTSDAAAVRAECARVLRKASQVADDNGLRGLSGSLSRDADRIEAAHPRPAEPGRYTREEVLAFGEAVRNIAADKCCSPISGARGSLAREIDALDLAVLLDATVKR